MLFELGLIVALTTAVASETVHGVVAFTRHGDRTTRMFPGYDLTHLGAQQAYNSGQFYRQRYVADNASFPIAGMAPDKVNSRQVWASAPNQGLLLQTATNFLQGLYPPLSQLDEAMATEALTNGSSYTGPLDSYQFILIQGQPATSQDTIWIKGDDNCPFHIASQKSYLKTPEYQTVFNETLKFYQRFVPLLSDILGDDGVSYENAYEVFDLMNVASIHNESIAGKIESSDLDQLRYLADMWEYNTNFNASEPARMIGAKTLIGGILRQMNTTVASGGRSNKFQLFSGSYDTFISFFGLTDLTSVSPDFHGLPDYASTIAFELFTEDGDRDSPANFPSADAVNETLQVRFLFRNGTDGAAELGAFPLFGGADLAIPYGQFRERMESIGITSVGQWCNTCGSSQDFCVAANETYSGLRGASTSGSSSSGLSNAAAGAIGAAVTLGVITIVGATIYMLHRSRRKTQTSAGRSTSSEKRSDSDSV